MKFYRVHSEDAGRARFDVFITALVVADSPEEAIELVISNHEKHCAEMDLGRPSKLVATEEQVNHGFIEAEYRG